MRDPLDAPSLARFVDREDETFTVEREGADDVEVRLGEVDVRDSPDGWEKFALRFETVGDTHLESGTYRLTNPRLDPFDASVSPTGTASPDPADCVYEATFNREVPEDAPDRGSDSLFGGGPSRRGLLGGALGVLAGATLLGGLFGGDDGGSARAAPASAGAGATGTDPYIGEITMFGGGFTFPDFAFCNGQVIPISQNTALFSLLGTTYGGDGRTTFALPDLRGRVPVHAGRVDGSGTLFAQGQKGGSVSVSLSESQIPSHTHGTGGLDLPVSTSEGDRKAPDGNALATQPDARGTDPIYSGTSDPGGSMDVAGSVGNTGGGQAHENMPPYGVVTYQIALSGRFPPRG
jgi:microcystin-dependent protein